MSELARLGDPVLEHERPIVKLESAFADCAPIPHEHKGMPMEALIGERFPTNVEHANQLVGPNSMGDFYDQ